MPELEAPDEDDDPEGQTPEDGGAGEGIGVGDGFDGVEDADVEKEQAAKVGSADLGLGDDDGIVSGFDGVEEEKGDSGEEETSSSSSSSSSSGDPSIEDAIESGLAEVASVGLEGQEREQVFSEMHAIAGKFKIGYFGNRCVQKYLKRDIDDIPPEYGLAAALIAFGAIAIYKRPDGEERIQAAVSVVKEKFSGEDEPVPPETPPEPRQERPPRREGPRPEPRRDDPPEFQEESVEPDVEAAPVDVAEEPEEMEEMEDDNE